ncbi:MAG: 2-oxoacid:acceptor oxidoreductase subunit alpha [Desulfobulbus sp.]|nr:MAG: 2-oxoacid:acceptor oxidoreductase subunit alpha [Desulfobulbus sp.]
MDITIRIGGEAGQGMQFIGSALAGIFTRRGLHVFTHQDYMSRIRGGHNFYQVRFSDRPVRCSREKVDILVALDGRTIEVHRDDLDPRGIVLYDERMTRSSYPEPRFKNIPFLALTEELGLAPIMANSAAVGAILGGLGLGLDTYAPVVDELMGKKGKEVAASNLRVARAGSDHVDKMVWPGHLRCGEPGGPPLLLLNGSQAIGTGAVVSGCRFYAAYPMTPSTGIMIHIASRAKAHGIVIEQAEDEIAAINMALGASFGGVRAMTGTSGGGFALMVEGLSLAGMTEIPVVIAEVQRPGPATGLPTRTEQSDLLFVLHAGHGEFPRVLFAPGTPEQALYLTNKAFDLAEKYQIPAIIQSDQYLADAEWSYPKLDPAPLRCLDYRDRATDGDAADYQRYRFTDSGVSPLAVPGLSPRLVVVDSDEHDEEGHIIEDAETRRRMVDKRWRRKWPALRAEIAQPLLYGHDRPELLLVGYGSTYGIMHDAVDILGENRAAAMLHFSELWPFPDPALGDYLNILRQARLAICVENNATGQLARLIRGETGFEFPAFLRKYDGRPFLLEPFMDEIHGLIGKI